MATQTTPSPQVVFDMLGAYQRTAALKSAIELDVFTAIDEGATSPAAIAKRCNTSERGARILCDFLTIAGLLHKSDSSYQLVPESAAFLSKRSRAYMGTMARFLAMPELTRNFEKLTDAVIRGGVAPEGNTVADENPIWIEFARAMVPMAVPAAQAIVDIVGAASAGSMRVLDIAAGHGIYGITVAERNPRAEVVAVDWAPVLTVAQEHARQRGVADRHRSIAGDAFKVDFGGGFDLALVTNFLHHFDAPTCTSFMKKVHGALKPGGRAVVLEFVPNPDRVTPPMAAGFSLTMLAGTPSGDAYTFAELRSCLESAGFKDATAHPLPPSPQTVIVATA
jgi:2-polyprenyl-3-methyl-5-hydroxy-6-metoxy-1,4-benzoquinol methylase